MTKDGGYLISQILIIQCLKSHSLSPPHSLYSIYDPYFSPKINPAGKDNNILPVKITSADNKPAENVPVLQLTDPLHIFYNLEVSGSHDFAALTRLMWYTVLINFSIPKYYFL